MITDLLKLERSLVAIDLETTGINSKVDRIIQIGVIKISPEGDVKEWQTLVNPLVPIPQEATAVHGITNELVKDAEPFARIAPGLRRGFEDCDFCGYNVTFDLGFLAAEFGRVPNVAPLAKHHIVDAFKVYQRMEPRNLSAAVRHYLAEELAGAHDAMHDVRATLRVLREQLIRHTDLPRTVSGLHDMFFKPAEGKLDLRDRIIWKNGEACFNFGVHAGKTLRDMAATPGKNGVDYLRWLTGDKFVADEYFKMLIRNALMGKFPEK